MYDNKEHVDYTKFGKELEEVQLSPVEEATMTPEGEEIELQEAPPLDPPVTRVRVNTPGNRPLNVRKDPAVDGDVVTTASGDAVLTVLDDTHPEWTFVEYVVDGIPMQGYVKKAFVAETTA